MRIWMRVLFNSQVRGQTNVWELTEWLDLDESIVHLSCARSNELCMRVVWEFGWEYCSTVKSAVKLRSCMRVEWLDLDESRVRSQARMRAESPDYDDSFVQLSCAVKRGRESQPGYIHQAGPAGILAPIRSVRFKNWPFGTARPDK